MSALKRFTNPISFCILLTAIWCGMVPARAQEENAHVQTQKNDSIASIAQSGKISSGSPCALNNWTYQNSGVQVNLNGVSFVDALTGWVVGDSGTIIHTTDGGANWVRQSSGVFVNLLAVKFGDRDTGISVGEHGTILRTTNGGIVWNKQTSDITMNLRSVDFAPLPVAIAVGDSGIILRSTDRGLSWGPESSGVLSKLNSVAFGNQGLGFAVGWNNAVLRTTDAGLSWTGLTPRSLRQDDYYRVSIGNDIVTLISGEWLPADYLTEFVLTSSDGGISWPNISLATIEPQPKDSVATIVYSGADPLYVTIGNLILTFPLHSNKWSIAKQAEGPKIHASSIADSNIFTAVGENGFILRTPDRRWSPQVSLKSPFNNSENLQLTVFSHVKGSATFSWNRIDKDIIGDSVVYGFELSEDSIFDCSNITYNTYTLDTAIVFSPLKSGARYYWRIVATGTKGQSQWSPVWTFTTQPVTLDQSPVMIYPVNGAINRFLDSDLQSKYILQFGWKLYPAYVQADGAIASPAIELQITTDSTFLSGIVSDSVYSRSDTMPYAYGLDVMKKYYWRVRSSLNNSYSPWSEVWSFATSDTLKQYPAFIRISPANDTTYAVTHTAPLGQASLAFRWNPYPNRRNIDGSIDKPTYFLQIGPDSSAVASGSCLSDIYDYRDSLGHTYIFIRPYRKYFWRMCARYTIGGGPWTDVWSFDAGIPSPSVQQIQQVPLDLLLVADSLQLNGPSYLQQSSFSPYLCNITVQCVVPPGILTKNALTIIVSDSGGSLLPWGSMMAQGDPWGGVSSSGPPDDYRGLGLTKNDYLAAQTTFQNIHQGDIISMTGFAVEAQRQGLMSNTQFLCVKLTVIDSSKIAVVPQQVSVSDFYGDGKIRLSTGEQFEGSVIELHNLTVHAIQNSTDSTFNMIDSLGNVMPMVDLSCWFTLKGHRNPASQYTYPHPGTHINMIRGVVYTAGGWYNIAPLFPGDIDFVADQPHSISGTVYNDDNRDSIMNPGERVLPGFRITLSGKVNWTVITDVNGKFGFGGLDTGTYSIANQLHDSPYEQYSAYSGPVSYTFNPAPESVSVNIGFHRPWNHISGKIFEDLNENGMWNSGEPWLKHWKVKVTGAQDDSVSTDSLGDYNFNYIDQGVSYLSLTLQPTWELIYPRIGGQYVISIDTLGKYYTNVNFAVHHIPVRIRLRLTVHDNIFSRIMEMYWGNRSGATYGIWGVDPGASAIDFSEEETELPPVSWAREFGFFDSRFQDPHNDSTKFGEGSWIDMRDFDSPSQIDTHLVIFTPEYAEGGGYPMTIGWDKDSIAASYSGDVSLIDPHGTKINMKIMDSLVISDNTIGSLLLIAHGPILPLSSRPHWSLVSVPGVPLYSDANVIFPMSQSAPFLFNRSIGYNPAAVMEPGRGFWLKCIPDNKVTTNVGIPKSLPDTLPIISGWNLIGAAHADVSTADITTVPPAITGNFISYNYGYRFVDTLKPFEGYWVNASQGGLLILGAGTTKNYKVNCLNALTDRAVKVVIHDADCTYQTLYLAPVDSGRSIADLSLFDMPPIPPPGAGDIRFASGRCLETVPAGKEADYPIQLSGSFTYPLTIECQSQTASPSPELSLKTGNRSIALLNNSAITINESSKQLILHSNGKQTTLLPKEYILEQNYPNPFNPATKIKYALPVASSVRLRIYNVIGQLVKTLVDGSQEAGYQEVDWNPTNAASGIYFCRLDAVCINGAQKQFTQIRKMVLIR
jgi:photosystem II stability/assembly factor-like uncharacterized protein